jgi:fatty-acyl-CoA synthase
VSQLPEMTLGDLLEQMATTHPHQEALVYSDRDLKYTFAELNHRVTQIARGLMAIGIQKGDHIGIWATNVPDWTAILFAAARMGAVLVTINTHYRLAELEYVLRQSDARALIIIDGFKDIDYVQSIYELVPELKTCPRGLLESKRFPSLKYLIYLGTKQHRGMYTLRDILLLGTAVEDREFEQVRSSLDPQDVVNMQYTSGTTGFPKGVMLTHCGILRNGFAIGERQGLGLSDRLCLPVPLFHCFGITLGVMAAYTHGATLVLLETFDPLMVLATIQKERCTALHGVPTMFIAELNHPMFNMFDLSTLRTGIMAGSPCPEPTMRQVMEKMYLREITVVYGLTEASPGITQTRIDDPVELRVSSVGRAFEGVDVKIVDVASGETLPMHQPGELCSRGYNTMRGYYKMPEETARAIDPEGWLHTGDLAVHTEDGYYKITGRLKDMIIRGGENIYPKEVEDFLLGMKEIRNVQIVGVPSDKYGEEVVAFVQLHPGSSLEPSEIQDYCRGQIARYKIPKYSFFLDEYPMTASGKIQKYKLREMATELVGQQREEQSDNLPLSVL